jgi:hypothetical protein
MPSAAAWKAGVRATTLGPETCALDPGPSRAPCTFWNSDRLRATRQAAPRVRHGCSSFAYRD